MKFMDWTYPMTGSCAAYAVRTLRSDSHMGKPANGRLIRGSGSACVVARRRIWAVRISGASAWTDARAHTC